MKKRLIAAVFLLLLWGLPAFAQGCAMCYQSAEQAGEKAQAALRHGILMLLVPTLGVMGGLGVATVYFRHPRPGGAAAAAEDLAAAELLEEEFEEEEV